jgi:hypothetical protein
MHNDCAFHIPSLLRVECICYGITIADPSCGIGFNLPVHVYRAVLDEAVGFAPGCDALMCDVFIKACAVRIHAYSISFVPVHCTRHREETQCLFADYCWEINSGLL